MRARQYLAALAAAVMLAGCGQTGTSSSSGASSGQQALRTGLAVQSKAEDGEMHTVAAAVWLDQEGRIQRAVVDEFEGQLASGEDGKNTWPEDLRTKRQKGDEDYPLQAVSEIGRGWADQADAFADHIEGMTAAELARLETDEHGRAADPDLLAGCTIAVDRYRDAVAAACEEARPIDEGGSLTRAVRGMVDGLRGR